MRLRRMTVLGPLVAALLLLAGAAVAEPDTDVDGVVDSDDNCPRIFNPDQQDNDGDEVGNTCDESKGIPAGESWVVFYLRDQEGRPVSEACFTGTEYLGDTVVGESEDCAEAEADTAGYILSELQQASADRAEISVATRVVQRKR
jgi:hypothetical protein